MPIQVVCPKCDKAYKVKDESAGKKLRCKQCETVFPIPAAEEEGDPWDSLPEPDEDDELPPARRLPPVQRKKPQTKAKRAKASSGDGVPVTIIVSMAICGLMMLLNLANLVMSLTQSNFTGVGGMLVRLGIEVRIIMGLYGRSNQARWTAIILDILGLVLAIPCGGILLFAAQMPQVQQNVPQGMLGILIGAVIGQIILWIVDLVMLVSPSAREYCNE